MRIIIETTDHDEESLHGRSIAVAIGSDHCDIDAVGGLIRSALLAWGFHEDSVRDLFRSES